MYFLGCFVMPRKPRIHFPGAIYHVITRGNNHDNIFAGKKEKHYYLEKLKEFRRKFNFNILIYVIMDNHAHLVIQVKSTSLSKIMHHLQQSYAIYYNREYNQSGHVFENRYKAYLCENERYLLALLRYIHLNPVTAKMTRDPEYPWSSHGYYSGKKKDNLVNPALIYSIIQQGQNLNPAEEYLRFMEQTTEELPIPGYLSSLQENPVEAGLTDNDIFILIDNITTAYRINREQLFSKSRVSAIAAARKELILTLQHKHHWTKKDIASLIEVSRTYVNKVITESPRPS